jgi:hypothetical protein
MYSWGGGCRPKISEWRKFPNISWLTKPRRCLLSGKWRRNLQTKIRIFYAQTYYRNMQCRRKLFFIGGAGSEDRRPEEIFIISKMPFPGLWGSFDRILMVRKQRFSMSKFTICFQFSGTKWAKAYLINYILQKLQESMGNMMLCSLSWIM